MIGITIPIASKLVLHGDMYFVKLNEQAFSKRLALCKHFLTVRIVLSKADVPWKLLESKANFLRFGV